MRHHPYQQRATRVNEVHNTTSHRNSTLCLSPSRTSAKTPSGQHTPSKVLAASLSRIRISEKKTSPSLIVSERAQFIESGQNSGDYNETHDLRGFASLIFNENLMDEMIRFGSPLSSEHGS